MEATHGGASAPLRGQFLRVEKYAARAPHGKPNGNDIWKVADEAERREGSCPHVDKPLTPRLLLGVTPRQAAGLADAWRRTVFTPYVTRSGKQARRRYRSDQACAMVGVISAPPEFRSDVKWTPFVALALDWLRSQYEDRLRCVVEHLDEPQPHLHFWVVPQKDERFARIHPGVRALERVGPGANLKLRNAVYKSAMSNLQDAFFEGVGEPSGLRRTTVMGERFTPEQQNTRRVHAALKSQREEEAALAVSDQLAALEKKIQEAERTLARYADHARGNGGPEFGPDGAEFVHRVLGGSYVYRPVPKRNPSLLQAARERQGAREQHWLIAGLQAPSLPAVPRSLVLEEASTPSGPREERARKGLEGTPFERESRMAPRRPRP